VLAFISAALPLGPHKPTNQGEEQEGATLHARTNYLLRIQCYRGKKLTEATGMNHPHTKQENGSDGGFTLIELSIVLVIIGLIVGGILVGRSLIRQAEISSVFADIQKFQTAVVDFETKYLCLPGDCANATAYFGTDSNGCPSGGGSTGTCNGDGNGQIGVFSDTLGYNQAESYRFWQQLGLAGMISGQYTGVPGPGGGRDTTIGVNVPSSRLPGGGYTMLYISYSSPPSSSGRWTVSDHFFEFGVEKDPWGTVYETDGYILTNTEAFVLDKKFDDGMPGSGTIMTIWSGWTCASTNDPSTAQYITSLSGIQCSLQFRAAF
jgi:prepilin-type N-terminal cleavage/methylation domain-containing protein